MKYLVAVLMVAFVISLGAVFIGPLAKTQTPPKKPQTIESTAPEGLTDTPYENQTEECLSLQMSGESYGAVIPCKIEVKDMKLKKDGDTYILTLRGETLEGWFILLTAKTKQEVTADFMGFLMWEINPCDGVEVEFNNAHTIETKEQGVITGILQDIALHRNCHQWNGGRSYLPAGGRSLIDRFLN